MVVLMFGPLYPSLITQSAIVAYLHYLSFMLCFAALLYERIRLKVNPTRSEAVSIVVADVIYGIAGVILLISGIFRVLKYGQGSEFYVNNPLFWVKIGLFASVGGLSLYPTFTYVLWAIPLSKGNLPEVSLNLVERFRLIINIELIGFALIPLFAALMARGIGLSS
tara:strand:- start:77 stop:574 length:498 start_codon:yes stop_codon:yes gene_type:complete